MSDPITIRNNVEETRGNTVSEAWGKLQASRAMPAPPPPPERPAPPTAGERPPAD